MNFIANGVIKDKVRDKVIYDCSIKKVEQINVCCIFSIWWLHYSVLSLFLFFISFPAWRSHGIVWINHDDHANAESKIESIRYFIWNWNW